MKQENVQRVNKGDQPVKGTSGLATTDAPKKGLVRKSKKAAHPIKRILLIAVPVVVLFLALVYPNYLGEYTLKGLREALNVKETVVEKVKEVTETKLPKKIEKYLDFFDIRLEGKELAIEQIYCRRFDLGGDIISVKIMELITDIEKEKIGVLHFTLRATDCWHFTNEEIIKVISSVGHHREDLQWLTLDFQGGCRGFNDQGLKQVAAAIEQNIPKLRKLDFLLNLWNYEYVECDAITSSGIGNFTGLIAHHYKNLEGFSLTTTAVRMLNDAGIEVLGHALGQLTKLKELNLGFLWISQVSIQSFSNELAKLKNLEKFHLRIEDYHKMATSVENDQQPPEEYVEHVEDPEVFFGPLIESLKKLGENLTGVKDLSINFGKIGELTGDLLDTITYDLVKKFTKLEHFALSFHTYDRLDQGGTERLVESLGADPTKLKSLKLVFDLYDLHESTCQTLIKSINKNLKSLESLTLRFNMDYQVKKETSETLIRQIGENLPNLKHLDLNIAFPEDTKSPGPAVVELTNQLNKHLHKLNILSLGLPNHHGINDQILGDLFKAVDQHLVAPEDFSLTIFGDYFITDNALVQFANAFKTPKKSFKNLALNFNGQHNVTDKGIKQLTTSIGQNFNSLNSLTINFESAQTNDESLNLLRTEVIQKLTNLQHLTLRLFSMDSASFPSFEKLIDSITDNLKDLRSLKLEFPGAPVHLENPERPEFKDLTSRIEEKLLRLKDQALDWPTQ